MQTRKFPRTMQQAFGPYTGHVISEPREAGYPAAWWACMALIAVFALVAVVVAA